MNTDFENNPEAVAFREWYSSISNRPGVAVLVYEPDNVVPVEYKFMDHRPEPGVDPSCSVRIFMRGYDGEVCNLDYFTAYPKVMQTETQEFVDAPHANVMDADAWCIGWNSVLEPLAHIVGKMQTEYMYKMAETVLFDIDDFIDRAEKHMHPFVAIHFAVVYLRYLLTKDAVSKATDPTRQHAADFMLNVIAEMLHGINDIAKGEPKEG